VVFAAVAAIQSLGCDRTQALAIAALQSEQVGVRRAALRVLGYVGHPGALEPIRATLRDPDFRVRDGAVMALALIDSDAAESQLLALTSDANPRIRASAVRALGLRERSAPALAALEGALADPDAWVRYYACQALGKLGAEHTTARLIALLDDEHGQVQVAAIEALSHFGSAQALAALREAASSPNPDIQRAALLGLSLVRDEASLPIVLAACASDDPATRLVALSAAQAFSSPGVIAVLSSAADDSNDAVRTAALGFLAARPEREASRSLIELLKQRDAPEPILAALSVPSEGRIAELALACEQADERLAPQLTSTLARLRQPEATAVLYDLLSSANVAARRATVSTLSAIGSRDAYSAIAKLSTLDPDPTVRRLCALFLAQ
jgi:HEAT repeat protein